MNKSEFAAMLDGREYGEEITSSEEELAKELGLVVVFGYSDDCMEFCGALDSEVGCYDGATVYILDGEVFEGCSEGNNECKFVKAALARAKPIEAVWIDKTTDCAWSYKTDIPHETFKIYEDGVLFCIGIVFDIKDAIDE